MKRKINVCVIDDEADVREVLSEVIDNSSEMQVVCESGSVSGGIEVIVDNDPDLIFLDIKLIGGDAFQLLNKLKELDFLIPPVVINTGYSDFEYAKRIFNEYKDIVIMILQKPFWEDWAEKEENILSKYYDMSSKVLTSVKNDRIVFRSRRETYIIRTKDIKLFKISSGNKGMGKTTMVTVEGEYDINKSMNSLERELPSNFIRISRFNIINSDFVEKYNSHSNNVYLKDYEMVLSMGMGYKERLVDYFEK